MSAAIGYEDWVRGGTPFPGAGSGGQNGNIGTFAALTTPQLSDVFGAQTGDPGQLAGGYFSWGDARPVQIVSLLDVRVVGSPTLDLYSLGPDASLISNQLDYAGYPSSQFIRHLHFIFSTPRSLTGVGMSINASAPGSSFTVGRLWAGPLWVPPNSIHREWDTSIDDPGEVLRSRGGQGYPRHEQRIRRVFMQLSHVSSSQAFGLPDNSVLDLQQLGYRIGSTEPVLVFPRTDDEHSIHRLGIYGHAAEPMRIRHGGGDQFSASLDFVELL